MSYTPPRFPCAPFIKEIGRGPRGARGLSRQDSHALYQAILAGRVSDVELGAVLMAYRIKGETAQELAGMCEAAAVTLDRVLAPPGTTPVVIASYNGARKQANLVPLLALLLARRGIPVLIHGQSEDPERITTAAVLRALDIAPAADAAMASNLLAERRLAYLDIAALSPPLAAQLRLRTTLGVRNSAHTIVKLLQPFGQDALRLVSYTHPPYRDTLIKLFKTVTPAAGAGILLARGTEGEAVADATLARDTLWLRQGKEDVVIAASARVHDGPPLPASRQADHTAAWIQDVLAGRLSVPAPIAAQAQAIAGIVTG